MRRRVTKIGLTILALSFLGGCMGAQSTWMYPHASCESLGQTPDEHKQQVVTVLDHDCKALTEDWDLWFQTDRPTRLTRWHGR